jgi:hypothetical protein
MQAWRRKKREPHHPVPQEKEIEKGETEAIEEAEEDVNAVVVVVVVVVHRKGFYLCPTFFERVR